ncbi:MAG: ANTAR domain-containing protein [Ignavibacteriota bacterium]
MSATAINPSHTEPILWKESFPEPEGNPIAPLLDLAILQAHAQGAYVYRFDRSGADATLVTFAGLPPASQGVPRRIAPLHSNRKTPVVLRSHAATDWRFVDFPEFQTARFDGVVSVPLLDSGETVGVANFCRVGDSPLGAAALSFLMSLSLPLGALVVASTLRDRLQKANQELADRKVFDRAKGLLQSYFQWTEEEAYLRIRRLSRRCRTPMRDIAQLVIESSAESLAEVLRQHE